MISRIPRKDHRDQMLGPSNAPVSSLRRRDGSSETRMPLASQKPRVLAPTPNLPTRPTNPDFLSCHVTPELENVWKTGAVKWGHNQSSKLDWTHSKPSRTGELLPPGLSRSYSCFFLVRENQLLDWKLMLGVSRRR